MARYAYDNRHKADSRRWRSGDFHEFRQYRCIAVTCKTREVMNVSRLEYGLIIVLVVSIAENAGTAGADSGNVRGTERAKFIERIGLTENHDRGELVVDHNRSSVKALPAIRVNRVSVVVWIVAMAMMVGRSVATPNMQVGAGIHRTGYRNANGHPKITSKSG